MDAKTLTLKDGRTLGYAEYGHPKGSPVFYFHGTPGSRLLPDDDIQIIERLGLHVILPERPGFGFSDYQPGRRVINWTEDVVQLADALKLERFGVFSVSGGGPYANACAYKIPERLTKTVIVSSSTSPDVFPEMPLLTLENAEVEAKEFAEDFLKDRDAFIQAAFPDASPSVKRFFLGTFSEAFRNGFQGFAHELMLRYALPWEFPLDAISSEVQIWHGEDDKNVSVEHAHYLATHIPNSSLHVLPETGHLIPPEQIERIMQTFIG